MAKKRFLNVCYENQLVEIDANHMERFSQVQKEVLLAFKEISVGYARIQLWNMTATPEIQFDDFEDIKALPEDYFWESKKPGALFLTVQLIPSPASNEGTISLSAQGTVLVLKRKDIVSLDWMVSRIIISSVPSFKHNMIYLDVDSTSFTSFNSLPNELKIAITAYLSPQDCARLGATCKGNLCLTYEFGNATQDDLWKAVLTTDNKELVKQMLKSGVDPSSNDNYAIRCAAYADHTEVVELLLSDERVDPDAQENLAIRWAAIYGSYILD